MATGRGRAEATTVAEVTGTGRIETGITREDRDSRVNNATREGTKDSREDSAHKAEDKEIKEENRDKGATKDLRVGIKEIREEDDHPSRVVGKETDHHRKVSKGTDPHRKAAAINQKTNHQTLEAVTGNFFSGMRRHLALYHHLLRPQF